MGPFQEEIYSLTEYLQNAFDCILNTDIVGFGVIQNGTTLGIPGGWLLCTLGHILQYHLESIAPLVKGDDIFSVSDKASILDI